MTNPFRWVTQVDDFNTNYIRILDILLPYLDLKKGVRGIYKWITRRSLIGMT